MIQLLFILTTLMLQPSYADSKSMAPCPDFKALTQEQESQRKELVKNHETYKYLESQPHEFIKVRVPNPSCKVDFGAITFASKPITIKQQLCRFKDFSFNYEIKNNKVFFKKGENPKDASLKRRTELLNKVLSSDIAKGFFLQSDYCYAELMDNNEWWIHLRNRKKQFCYLKASNNGNKVEMIKRLYAKDSQCLTIPKN